MDKIQVFDPTTEAKARDIDFVPRPESLRDLRIGLVQNTKFNSDRLLLKISDILESEYGAKNHIIRGKPNAAVPPDEEVIEELVANCDVVIAGIGD